MSEAELGIGGWETICTSCDVVLERVGEPRRHMLRGCSVVVRRA